MRAVRSIARHRAVQLQQRRLDGCGDRRGKPCVTVQDQTAVKDTYHHNRTDGSVPSRACLRYALTRLSSAPGNSTSRAAAGRWCPRPGPCSWSRGSQSRAGSGVISRLTPRRRPRAAHDSGKVLLDVALAVAMGWECPTPVTARAAACRTGFSGMAPGPARGPVRHRVPRRPPRSTLFCSSWPNLPQTPSHPVVWMVATPAPSMAQLSAPDFRSISTNRASRTSLASLWSPAMQNSARRGAVP